MGGHHHLRGLLRRQTRVVPVHQRDQRGAVEGAAPRLGGQLEHGGGVAQGRSEIRAPAKRFGLPCQHRARPAEHRIGAHLVAIGRQRRAQLCDSQRRGEIIRLGIRIVAQIAHRRCALARQHQQRIGDILAPVVEIGRIADPVAQVVHRQTEGEVGHRMTLRARP